MYDVSINPRHSAKAPALPLTGKSGEHTITDALQKRVDAEKALEIQANGDVVELMEVSYRASEKVLVLLFHRASPNAADPHYRKKARDAATKKTKVTTRQAKRQAGEEPSVSAHLVIEDSRKPKGRYRAALEEIPGISMSVIQPIIALALRDYAYQFTDNKKKTGETYTTFKANGLKSATLESTLKDGHAEFVTLTRPATAPFVDSGDIFQATTETMKLRVTTDSSKKKWLSSIGALRKNAIDAGWDEVTVDIKFDDKRRKTVVVERDEAASEILFVRSEFATFQNDLDPCSVEVHDETVSIALGLIKKS